MAKTIATLNTSPSFSSTSLNTSPSFTAVTLPTSVTWLIKGFWSSFNINNWEDTTLSWEEAE
tara:strand:+ start:3455 stop:3640 length:186 start_codon:yes stop_codon:yes gene_type:complete